ncbi:MAG TPA: glycosyltransferase family 4 protein, partial [Tepidisphaeraceae bacterium]|nr:glycosyltransferase family 4 protein [Tepidisphaeraceae bacterium]
AAAAVASVLSPGVQLLQSIQSTMPEPKWHWWLQRVLHRRAAKMFVPSESIAQALRERSHVPADKISVISNAIGPDEFSPSTVPKSDPRPYPIGFLGRLHPVKRIEDLLQAMPLLSGLAHLHIFGLGPQEEVLVAQTKQLGIQGSVTFHGPVKMPQEALSNIGLLVLPSSSEGFGLVLIEAMAAGVPVIGTNVPGIRDVIRDGQNGLLVPPFSPVALADAIRRVIERPELRRELVEQATRDVRERFSWSRVLERYCQLLALD